ncbi:MAG TPA: methyltransferase domain-containing protein [Candidatus Acidoferrales bacterium]
MSAAPLDPEQFAKIKQGMKATWSAGDFGQIARYSAEEGANFIARLPIQAGMTVLDVACGTGNLAIPAARAGARVTGVDIAENLLAQARERAAAENLAIDFRYGDAEQLAFADNSFDMVVSMYGAMFAPRPELVAAELARVVRPGGLIAMANWTPEGFVGKSFAVTGRLAPPPVDLPKPVLWGTEDVARQRFAAVGCTVETHRRMQHFKYPYPAARVVAFFREYFGPTQVAFSRLDAAGQAKMTAELEKLWADHNHGPANESHVDAEYLEVRATKPK